MPGDNIECSTGRRVLVTYEVNSRSPGIGEEREKEATPHRRMDGRTRASLRDDFSPAATAQLLLLLLLLVVVVVLTTKWGPASL